MPLTLQADALTRRSLFGSRVIQKNREKRFNEAGIKDGLVCRTRRTFGKENPRKHTKI